MMLVIRSKKSESVGMSYGDTRNKLINVDGVKLFSKYEEANLVRVDFVSCTSSAEQT